MARQCARLGEGFGAVIALEGTDFHVSLVVHDQARALRE